MFEVYSKIDSWCCMIVQLFYKIVIMIVCIYGVLGVEIVSYLFENGMVVVIQIMYQMLVYGVSDFCVFQQFVQIGKMFMRFFVQIVI